MIEDRMECPSCHRGVVPQLWVDSRDRLEHPRVVHLCPFCGVTLRKSGGGINKQMLAFIIASIGLFVLIFVLLLLKVI
jgi:hypothetical protein